MQNPSATYRAWIEIDLDKLIDNYRTACSLTQATVTCVLKSNAYGHGAVRVAHALQAAGCASFAVSTASEAIELRNHGITGEILIMALTEAAMLPRVLAIGARVTVASVEDLNAVQAAAKSLGCKAYVHIKIDTGMHRLGFVPEEKTVRGIAAALRACPLVVAEGLFSHLALTTQARDQQQYDSLMAAHRWLAEEGVAISDVHICDSIGLVRYPAWHGSRVRVGAMLYGVRPSRSAHMPFTCHETLTFKARVLQVHDVAAGDFVGYSDDQPLSYDARIATISVGYGDGYPRCLSNGRGKVLLHGQPAPVEGLVCMDQMMVDVTHIPGVQAGDTATLLGGGVRYDDYAEWANTNRNEAITILSRRPVRVYYQAGQPVYTEDVLAGESGANV